MLPSLGAVVRMQHRAHVFHVYQTWKSNQKLRSFLSKLLAWCHLLTRTSPASRQVMHQSGRDAHILLIWSELVESTLQTIMLC